MVKALYLEDAIVSMNSDYQTSKNRWDDDDFLINSYNLLYGYKRFCNIADDIYVRKESAQVLKTPLYINPHTDLCSICLDGFKSHKNSFILSCGHKYHKSCIVSMLHFNKADCPCCRKKNAVYNELIDSIDLLSYSNTMSSCTLVRKEMIMTLSLLYEIDDYNFASMFCRIDIDCHNPMSHTHSTMILNRKTCKKCKKYTYNTRFRVEFDHERIV